jgi:lysophospholipase L1-like esterase
MSEENNSYRNFFHLESSVTGEPTNAGLHKTKNNTSVPSALPMASTIAAYSRPVMEFQLKFFTYPSLIILTVTLAACGGGGMGETGGTSDRATTTLSSAQVLAAAESASGASSADRADGTALTVSPTMPAVTVVNSPPPVVQAPAQNPTTTTSTTTTATTATVSPAPAPAPAPTPTPSTPQLIEYYGDSTVWGYRSGVGSQVAKPAPVAFAEALPNPSAYVVRNEGVSGSTACGLLNGTDGKHQPWPKQMAASSAKYVFVNHAINDEWTYDVNTYKSCLHSLAQTAKQYGKQMIFETPNPTRDSGSWGLDVYVNAMKEVATQENVPVIGQYKYLTDYLNGQSPYTICPDGLHPTDAVYLMKGKYAASVFASLFIK